MSANIIIAPASAGDIADRISILRVKSVALESKSGRRQVKKEIAQLEHCLKEANISLPIHLMTKLQDVNAEIYDLMELLFSIETSHPDYLDKVASTIALNKERAFIKREINDLIDSGIREVKSFF